MYYNKILDVNGVIQIPSAITTSSATLTGALSAASASLTGGLTCSSLTLNSVVMPTTSYIMVQNTLASVLASSTTDITWTTVSNMGITFSGSTITIPTVGVYVLSGKVSMNTALIANCSFNVKAYYGITWTTIAQYQLRSLGAGGDFNMVNFTLGVALPNQYIKKNIH